MWRFCLLFVMITAALIGCRTEESPSGNPTSTASSPAVGREVRVSPDHADATEVAIAADGQGPLLVVWTERNGDKNYDIFVRRYNSDLSPVSDPVRVNPNPGEARAWYGDMPSVIAAPGGIVYIGWNRKYAGGEPGNDLMLSISENAGLTFKEPIKVNDDSKPASHGMHSMTLDDSGRILISWLDERYLRDRAEKVQARGIGPAFAMFFHHTPTPAAPEPESQEPDAELYFASIEGGKVSPNRKIGEGICPCCRVSMAASGQDVFVGYRKVYPGQKRHISVSASHDGGETFGEPVLVSDDQWQIFACPVTGPALAFEGGRLRIAWYAGGEREPKGLYTAVSTDGGKTFAGPELVSTASVYGSPDLAGGTVVFGDGDKIYRSDMPGSANGEASTIANGRNPAVVRAGESIVTAFVRPEGQRSSVWLTLNQMVLSAAEN